MAWTERDASRVKAGVGLTDGSTTTMLEEMTVSVEVTVVPLDNEVMKYVNVENSVFVMPPGPAVELWKHNILIHFNGFLKIFNL